MATALITGASAGLGAEFAWQLATAKRDLVLVARSKDRLEEMARTIAGAAGVSVEVIVADLATTKGVNAVKARLADAERPIDLLVNNAGLGQGAPFVNNDLSKELAALDVMVRAVMILSHTAARAMVERGRGAILNVSSVASWLGNGTYAAHKAWVTAFTEGLAGELKGTGVSATAVLPGLTHTEFHDRAGITETMPEFAWLDAEDVVAQALAAVRRKQVLVTPSIRYAAIAQAARVAPRSLVRAISGAARARRVTGSVGSLKP